ncbi:MAG: plasma-membrane proton-efflux P-type ATPase [Candidatus Omnitrophica bacterium]|nr:plasma-membrane proton-efflux P-type ATPase [Candidatus Omnitrophota bacterium]
MQDEQRISALQLKRNDAEKLSIDQVLNKLSTGRTGLVTSAVNKRLEELGYNELVENKKNPLLKILGYFWGPIPFMLELAAILSGVIKHWEDFWIIFVMLILNAVVGFVQEFKAGNAIELLKKKLAPNAKVLRDGMWVTKLARELVPGDVIRIRLGDVVPADVKIISDQRLQMDEAALTGESLPFEKKINDIVFSGTIVKQGETDAVVISTGMNTFFGKTAGLIDEEKMESHFQKAVVKIGEYLIALAVMVVLFIFLLALFRHESIVVTIQFALVLLVAAVPAALPSVLSITMAAGASALAKKDAIVSRLASVEELAGMDVLCSDKTGTITKNELTIKDVEVFDLATKEDVLICAALASREEDSDPIDCTVINEARKCQDFKVHTKKIKMKNFVPFDPITKRTEASFENEFGEMISVSKGAPQVILALLGDGKDTDAIMKKVETFALSGFRTIAVARKENEDAWTLLGMIPMYDPPRDDSRYTIETAQKMGVKVKMITGDHTAIAVETAKEVGINRDIRCVKVIQDQPDRAASRIIEEAGGIAEVYPEHKYHIVDLLQKNGHIVGMTGDGVNDAPALNKADVGIAVEGATDAAKSAADIVLTKPGLSVIIDAIQESRRIFQRMKSYAIYRIAETIRVLFFIAATIVIFNFYPVTAVMIVMLALFNDVPIMAIAYDNVKYSMKAETWNMREILSLSTFLGITGVFVTFSIFYIAQEIFHLDRATIQTFIFLKLAVAGHLTIFMTRTKGHFWSIRPATSLLSLTVITKILATLVAIYGIYMDPIGWKLAGFVWMYALLELVVTDYFKVKFVKLIDHSNI